MLDMDTNSPNLIALLRAYTAREDNILPYNGWANDFAKLQATSKNYFLRF